MIKCNRCKTEIKISTGIFRKNNTPFQTITLNKKKIDLCHGCVKIVLLDIENTKLSPVELLFKKQ